MCSPGRRSPVRPTLSDLLRSAWNHDPRSGFPALAEVLLNQAELAVAGRESFRLAEIEFFLFRKDHPDPFTHRKPVQHEFGRWYFHQVGASFRGGTFKGLDITLGDGASTFGILIRSIVAPDGTITEGPCRVVDSLLARTRMATVADLHQRIGQRLIWDPSSPVYIRESRPHREAVIYRTARIGLFLKRNQVWKEGPRFIALPYRFLTEPRRIARGKPHLAVALHGEGKTLEEIAAVTGSPRAAIGRYIGAFESGRGMRGFDEFFGKGLDSEELCSLLGVWDARRP